ADILDHEGVAVPGEVDGPVDKGITQALVRGACQDDGKGAGADRQVDVRRERNAVAHRYLLVVEEMDLIDELRAGTGKILDHGRSLMGASRAVGDRPDP